MNTEEGVCMCVCVCVCVCVCACVSSRPEAELRGVGNVYLGSGGEEAL